MGKLYFGCFLFAVFAVASIVALSTTVETNSPNLYWMGVVLAIATITLAFYWFITTLLYAVTLAMRITFRKATPEEAKAGAK